MARLAVVGDAAVDYTVELPADEAPDEKVFPTWTRRTLGGTGANSAVVAAALGSDVTLVTAVGDDPDGAWVRRELADRGLSTAGVRTAPGRTVFATILLRGGERQVIVDAGVDVTLDDDALAALRHMSLVYVSYSPQAVAALARAGLGPRVVAGFEGWMVDDDLLASLAQCRLAITNEAGWAALAARAGSPGVPVVVTRGAEGAELRGADGSVTRFPAHTVEVVDATGAGDCFAGTLSHYLAGGLAEEDALRRAMVAGALATTAVGAQGRIPSAEELERAVGGPHP